MRIGGGVGWVRGLLATDVCIFCVSTGAIVSVVSSSFIDRVWEQFQALIPSAVDEYPLGCHCLRVSDRVVFDRQVQVQVCAISYVKIADSGCWAITIRTRRDEWITARIFTRLEQNWPERLRQDDRPEPEPEPRCRRVYPQGALRWRSHGPIPFVDRRIHRPRQHNHHHSTPRNRNLDQPPLEGTLNPLTMTYPRDLSE